VLDSTDGEHKGFTLFDCAGPDDALRSVWLYGGQDDDVADEMTVEAELLQAGRAGRGHASGTCRPHASADSSPSPNWRALRSRSRRRFTEQTRRDRERGRDAGPIVAVNGQAIHEMF
jgi:hypothetical protein